MHPRGAGRSRSGPIRPPRKVLRAPVKLEDVPWNTLKSALVDIQNKNCSTLSYEQLYRASYRIVHEKRGSELYDNVQEFERKWLEDNVVTDICALVHGRGTHAIALGVGSAAERIQASEDMLRGVRDAWESHRVCMNLTADVLLYLERNWVSDVKRPSIWMTTIGLFRDHVLKAVIGPETAGAPPMTVMDMVNGVVYNLVQMEREGHVMDRNLVRGVVYMLEGLWETDDEDKESGKLYLTLFEPEFLRRSGVYFEKEGERLLRDGDAATWIWRAQSALEAEDTRCDTMLSPLTREKIRGVILDTMVRPHLAEFVALEATGLRFMVHNNRWDEVQALYQLAMMVGQRDVLVKAVASQIVALGLEVEKQVLATLSAEMAAADKSAADKSAADKSAADKSAAIEKVAPQTSAAIKWVEDVHGLLDMFERLWERCFARDTILHTAISKAFSGFIERFARASEFASLYVDDNLRRGVRTKTEPEVDRFLANAIAVIRYLPDKDMFERYYQKHLARRLLYARSENQDVEREMIARMKQEMGNQFTSKFEGMFKDLGTSQDVTEGFREKMLASSSSSSSRIELSVSILTSNYWPPEISRGVEQSAVVYPPEIARLQESLTHFYLSSRSGRRLQWVDASGNADIKCLFPAVAGKTSGPLSRDRRYELNVTTHGMVVLLLFNEVPDDASLTLEEVQQRTGIPQRELLRTLGVLSIPARSRVLSKTPMSRSVQPGDRFAFNREFVSKSIKIRAATTSSASRVEDPQQRKDTEDSTIKTRSYIVDAAVVRIMKQRKTLSHTNLVSEVVGQMAGRFKPEIGLIKKRIEDLIAREYLERVEGQEPAAYVYLS